MWIQRIAVLATLILSASARAFDRLPSQYQIQHWTEADGLPSNALQPNDVDASGYRWIATAQGLSRFDGRRFVTFNSSNTAAFPSDEVRTLKVLRDGRLLIALASGWILEKNGAQFVRRAALGTPVSSELIEAADGSVYLSSIALWRLPARGDMQQLLSPEETGSRVRLTSHAGRLFALDDYGRIASYDLESGERLGVRQIPGYLRGATTALHHDGRTLWISSSDQRMGLDVESWKVRRLTHHLGLVPSLMVTPGDGSAWIAGHAKQHALCRIGDLERDQHCEAIPVPASSGTGLQRDRDGALWLSTWDNGLFRISAPPILRFGLQEGVAENRVRSLLRLRDGRVLARSPNSAVAIDGLKVRPLAWPAMRNPGDRALALAQLPDGRLVRGRFLGIDVASAPDFSTWRDLSPPGVGQVDAYALHTDSAGNLWTAAGSLRRYAQGRWQTLQDRLSLAYAFVEDADGRLWVAMSDGIYRSRSRSDSTLERSDAPVPEGRFILMSAMRDSLGHLWFGGYECGVYRFDGKHWLHLTVSRGLPNDTAYAIVEDQQQRLWISHGRGLYTLSLREAERLQSQPKSLAQVRSYQSSDGLPVSGFNGGSGLAGLAHPDGQLYFVADSGVVRLNPEQLPQALTPPGVVLEEAWLDEQAVLVPAVLAPGVKRLALRLAAPAPGLAQRISLRYRISPLQPEWRALPSGGMLELQRLPPGDYQLHAQAGVDGSDWGDSYQLRFVQLPYWYQRPLLWWFTALTTAVMVYGLFRWRMAALRASNRTLQQTIDLRSAELAAERKRVLEAEAAQRESERVLHWHRVHKAQQEWAQLDHAARLAYALVARAGSAGASRAGLMRLLSQLDPGLAHWQSEELKAPLARLLACGALRCEGEDFFAAQDDWQLLPDLNLPLAELAARTQRRIGAYRMLERLGTGGMGEVYRALNVHDGSEAAVKVLHPEATHLPESRRRLQREGDIVSALAHPNLVRLLERGEYEGRLYLAMEYLAGSTLGQRIQERGAMPEGEVLAVLSAVASGLAALHAADVVHRDVHPNNIMLTLDGRVVLLDFGLARASEQSAITRAQTLLGTLPYLAPEVLRGEAASPASDLFALGMVGFELSCGQRYWRAAQTLDIVVEMAAYQGPQALRLEQVPERLRALLLRLLDPEPSRRDSARVWIRELELAIAAS